MDQSSLACRPGQPSHSSAAQVSYVFSDSPVQQGGPSPPNLPKGKRRLLWGLGGTLLSGLGFIALALFEQYNGMLSELRGDLKHFNETSSEYVKKDNLQRLREHTRQMIQEMHASTAARARVEMELQASEKARDQMASELQRMRERLAYLEGRQTMTPALSSVTAGKK